MLDGERARRPRTAMEPQDHPAEPDGRRPVTPLQRRPLRQGFRQKHEPEYGDRSRPTGLLRSMRRI